MTKIEWTDETWNPTTGCTKVSPGCDHCYAETLFERFHGKGSFAEVTLHPERLDLPLRWRKPRRVFVNSMSDLFHHDVTDEFIAQVWAVMAATPQHTYQVLTKRHSRMRSLLSSDEFDLLPNVWVGCSVEDQHWADIRIPALLETPAAVRFLSCEPLLGPVAVHRYLPNVGWVIVGGESGPGARPMDLGWARSLVEQCAVVGAACFVKQLGSVAGRKWGAGPKGGDMAAWPVELRVRQWPAAAGRGAGSARRCAAQAAMFTEESAS